MIEWGPSVPLELSAKWACLDPWGVVGQGCCAGFAARISRAVVRDVSEHWIEGRARRSGPLGPLPFGQMPPHMMHPDVRNSKTSRQETVVGQGCVSAHVLLLGHFRPMQMPSATAWGLIASWPGCPLLTLPSRFDVKPTTP